MEEQTSAAGVPAELVGSWTLIAFDGEPFEFAGKTPTLEIREDGVAGGTSGVNRFTTGLDPDELADGRISFGQAATTRKAGPPEAMAFEQTFLERLSAISDYDIDGDTLRLWAGDTEALTFERSAE